MKVTCAATTGSTCDSTKSDMGCGEGKNCAISPEEVKNTCVASEACDKTVEEVITVCGATRLATSILAVFAIALTL